MTRQNVMSAAWIRPHPLFRLDGSSLTRRHRSRSACSGLPHQLGFSDGSASDGIFAQDTWGGSCSSNGRDARHCHDLRGQRLIRNAARRTLSMSS